MSDHLIDIIGWVGFILIIVGYYLNAKKKLYCFYIWGIGNLIYVFYGLIINDMPIILANAGTLILSFFLLLYKIKYK